GFKANPDVLRFHIHLPMRKSLSSAPVTRALPLHKKPSATLAVRPTPQTVDALMKLDLAAGVDVEIKLA
ncbi:MAG TPA: hypothetical protein VNJ05_10425, partial [Sphingomicrobium sp.]|nr:hypothetical protein [Sphingomicrobium sp.]